MYRCAVSFYFLVWLIYNGSNSRLFGPPEKFFIFLTNWSFIAWNLYLLASAISVAINQLQQYYHCCKKRSRTQSRNCCTCNTDETTLCDKLSWLLFTISAELAVGVTLLYWTLLRDDESDTLYSGGNLNVHLINGIVAILDLWIIGIPIHIFHVFYTLLFASTYAAFTGVYFVANGTSREGENYIYPVLDYESNPGLAAGLVVGAAFVVVPIIHGLFIVQYLLRNWVTARVHKKVRTYRRFLFDEEPVRKSQILESEESDSISASNRLSVHTCETSVDDEFDL